GICGAVLPGCECASVPLDERAAGLLMRALHQAGRPGEALQVYTDFRRRYVAELGLEPGPALRETHRRVLGDDQRTVVAQLPGALADFTGRPEPLSSVTRALTGPAAGTSRVVVVTGPGGTGKTTLAVRAAHAVKADFPDGQLYADLHGWGGTPADPAETLAAFLRALGVAGPA
ncbi:AfsR/SARP family transcriptional regulator, partial [Actinocorallia lasiicapitis]